MPVALDLPVLTEDAREDPRGPAGGRGDGGGPGTRRGGDIRRGHYPGRLGGRAGMSSRASRTLVPRCTMVEGLGPLRGGWPLARSERMKLRRKCGRARGILGGHGGSESRGFRQGYREEDFGVKVVVRGRFCGADGHGGLEGPRADVEGGGRGASVEGQPVQ